VLGDEDAAAVVFREHPARVEPHAQCRDVRAERARRRREVGARFSS
jgi:hypothetical protein